MTKKELTELEKFEKQLSELNPKHLENKIKKWDRWFREYRQSFVGKIPKYAREGVFKQLEDKYGTIEYEDYYVATVEGVIPKPVKDYIDKQKVTVEMTEEIKTKLT